MAKEKQGNAYDIARKLGLDDPMETDEHRAQLPGTAKPPKGMASLPHRVRRNRGETIVTVASPPANKARHKKWAEALLMSVSPNPEVRAEGESLLTQLQEEEDARRKEA